jgi:hypothetical protein
MVTAIPKPMAVGISFETAMKEHMPKKLEKIMLLVKIEAISITNG